MKREQLKEELKDLIVLNGVPYSYYIRWKEYDNIFCNEHGKYSELENVIDKMENAQTCIQGELMFDMLVVYFNTICVVFQKNENWDCVNDDSDTSHNIFGIPYVGVDGNWKYLNGTPKTEYIE